MIDDTSTICNLIIVKAVQLTISWGMVSPAARANKEG